MPSSLVAAAPQKLRPASNSSSVGGQTWYQAKLKTSCWFNGLPARVGETVARNAGALVDQDAGQGRHAVVRVARAPEHDGANQRADDPGAGGAAAGTVEAEDLGQHLVRDGFAAQRAAD